MSNLAFLYFDFVEYIDVFYFLERSQKITKKRLNVLNPIKSECVCVCGGGWFALESHLHLRQFWKVPRWDLLLLLNLTVNFPQVGNQLLFLGLLPKHTGHFLFQRTDNVGVHLVTKKVNRNKKNKQSVSNIDSFIITLISYTLSFECRTKLL